MSTIESVLTEAIAYNDRGISGMTPAELIEWDGRPLSEIAADLCVLLDAREGDDKAASISARLWAAIEAIKMDKKVASA